MIKKRKKQTNKQTWLIAWLCGNLHSKDKITHKEKNNKEVKARLPQPLCKTSKPWESLKQPHDQLNSWYSDVKGW